MDECMLSGFSYSFNYTEENTAATSTTFPPAKKTHKLSSK